MSMKPSVGRRVWYWPHPSERNYDPLDDVSDGSDLQPFDAGIARVNKDGTINVSIVSDSGYPMTPRQGVMLRETPDQAVAGECSWMPYQVGQAKANTQSPSEPLPGA